jgi:hypothetical protein
MTSGLASTRRISSIWVARSMVRPRDLMASYRPLSLMSASMPDRRSVSLAPVNTLAPSGIRSLMRARAAAASSRISTAKFPAVSAAATRSSRSAGAGAVNVSAGPGVAAAPAPPGVPAPPDAPALLAAPAPPGASAVAGAPAGPGTEPASGVVSRYLTS